MKRIREDYAMMNWLPDDILISIISRLSLREATATSILSTRWRRLWTYVTRLHLPPFKAELVLPHQREIMAERFEEYVKTIDHILDSHRGNQLKEFKLDMYNLQGARVDKWFEFAVAKEVEVVEMHLDYKLNAKHGVYSLQLQRLIMPSVGGRCLKYLSLSAFHVEDSEVGLLLSNFPLLESLSIAFSESLRKISIVGTKLKQLEICHAPYLQAVEIHRMMDLSSLKLHCLGYKHSFALSDVPNLVEFSSVDEHRCTLDSTLSRVAPSICAQLRTLKITRKTFFPPLTYSRFNLEFKNVKHLELEYGEHEVNEPCYLGRFFDLIETCPTLEKLDIKVRMNVTINFARFFDLIETCPTLEKLDIKMKWYGFVRDEELMEVNERAKISWKKYTSREVSPYLKEMNLWGFCGSAGELGLVFSILNHFKSLQQIILQACDVSERVRQIATARAWHHMTPKLNNSTCTLQVI